MGAVTKEMLTCGVPVGYDEQTWLEIQVVKHTLSVKEKMKIEGDSVSAMTDEESLSSYARHTVFVKWLLTKSFLKRSSE